MAADDTYGRLGDDHPAYTMGRAADMLGTTQGFLRAIGEKPALSPRSDPQSDTGATPATNCASPPVPASSSTKAPPSKPPAASSSTAPPALRAASRAQPCPVSLPKSARNAQAPGSRARTSTDLEVPSARSRHPSHRAAFTRGE
ncbi:hypothetical protein SHO565_59660 [Streptomyces sp. HO565]